MLAIRADANARIGLGHAMRCFALVEGWRARGGEAVFFSGGAVPDQVAARLEQAGIGFRVLEEPDDGCEFAEAARRCGATWLVVDGPFADAGYAAAARAAAPLLLIDDAADKETYPADLLLNQNVQAGTSSYEGRTKARILAGPRFALIRSDLRQDLVERGISETPKRILALVGGADPNGYLARLTEAGAAALSEAGITGGQVDAVVGPANAWRPEALISGSVVYRVGVRDLGALIAAADIVLSSAGSTVWELALHGTPMILGASVPVEEPVGAGMAAQGAALYLGRLRECAPERISAQTVRLLKDAEERKKLSRAAAALVDGRGVERVLDAMLELTGEGSTP
ncbi:PseG/SpsG family protein [Nisaea sp.]|uniref:PseG/SpsG family protein n=1 Tax=Nisaea sp. TaxID=2024842 RepID=UPI003B522F19